MKNGSFFKFSGIAMKLLKRLSLLGGLVLSALFFSAPAYAECGGHTQCIAVGLTDHDARIAHHGLGAPPTPTLNFVSQSTGTASASSTIYVAAVTGPVGTMAILGPITLSGTDAADFSITGGTCSPTNGPIQDAYNGGTLVGGTLCTITVAFNPATTGPKTATVNVPLNPPPGCAGCITGRTITLTGTGTLAPPVITSALAASGQAGVPFPGYQITATNSPTSFTASPLPPGLSISASGAISGTPTTDGTYNTVITATNAAGTGTQTLVFTISLLAPVITSGSTASGATGQAFSYQITATNNPTSFTASSLPPGLTVSASSGAILGTPTAGGTYSVSVTATNSTGTASQVVTITIALVPPTVQSASLNITLNTPTTIDLAPYITGTAISGISITAAPIHGTAAVSGTKVTYAPTNNYFGPDAFSYVALNNDGTSSPGIVTVTVTGRPDPVKDVTVVGMLAAQADTAQRFSGAQSSNFQHRMESLHRRSHNEAGASPGLAADASRTVAAGSTAAVAANRRLDGGSDIPPNNNPLLRVSEAPAVSSLPDLAGGVMGLKSVEFANNIVSLLTTQSVNLSSLADQGADGSGGATGISNFWVAGTVNFGTRDATGGRNGLDFTSSGISIGVDHRFSDQWALGLGAGFARDKTDIGNDGSLSRANGSSIAFYGSYQPSQKTFVDGLIGVGTLKFETQRYVSAINDYARGSRNGYQAFSSLAAGYEQRDNGRLVSPYARLNYSSNQLKQSTETGTGQFDLTYFSQTSSAIQGALGVRAEAIHPTSFGIASPRIRAEYQHDFRGQRQASVAYADQPGGPQYAVPAGATKRNAIEFGIGNDFVTRNGTTFGIDYQILHTFSQDTNYAVLLQFSKNFDERGPSTSPGGSPILSFSKPLGIQVDSSYTFDNNVTRGNKTRLVDSSYAVSLRKIAIFPINDHTRALLTGLLDGDKFYRYNGLSSITGGVQGELQYRRSAEFSAATFGLFARASDDQYKSDLRDGHRYSTGISMRQPVTDRISMFGALAHNRRNSKNEVFDIRDNSVRLNLDYELNPTGTIYLGGEHRRGDVVTMGPPPGMHSTSVSVLDDAFPGGQLFSYRFDGSTVITTLGYNIGMGSRDSFDFSWRRIHSTIDAASSSGLYASSTPASSYTSNQFSVAYLVRF